MGRAFIGTSGWVYKDWAESFYPQDVKVKDRLGYLASQLDSAEINSSFYRFPRAENLEKWQDETPARFRFAIKLSRGITHYRKLRNCRQLTVNFLEIADALRVDRRGPLLIQLPKNQRKDLEKLEAFLDELKDVAESTWRVAFEFRHESWLDDEVRGLLDRRKVALVVHDMKAQAPVDEPNDAPFVYVRRHGPTDEKYKGSYSEAELKGDAERVRRWMRGDRWVWVYFNNDVAGAGAQNARRLKELVEA